MEESILNSTKAALGIEATATEFDVELIMHINSVLAKMTDFGFPTFAIESSRDEWFDYMGEQPMYNDVRTYLFQCVKMVFDPPQAPALISINERMIAQTEYRITNRKEAAEWVSPETLSSST